MSKAKNIVNTGTTVTGVVIYITEIINPKAGVCSATQKLEGRLQSTVHCFTAGPVTI